MKTAVSLTQAEYIRRRRRHRTLVTAGRCLLLVLFLTFWELFARLGIIDDFIFSSPSRTLRCFLAMTADGTLFLHTGITVAETILSFLFVTLFGITGAVLFWSFKSLSEILEPYLVMLNSLPKSALAPLLIVWLGSNLKTIITAAVSVALFGAVLTLHNGFSEIDRDQIKLIRSLGGTKKDILLRVLLPASLPLLISNMKVNIGLCLVGVIIGEFLAADRGLGYLIIYGSQVFRLDLVLMSIVILCIVSAFLYGIIASLEKYINSR